MEDIYLKITQFYNNSNKHSEEFVVYEILFIVKKRGLACSNEQMGWDWKKQGRIIVIFFNCVLQYFSVFYVVFSKQRKIKQKEIMFKRKVIREGNARRASPVVCMRCVCVFVCKRWASRMESST